MYGYLSDKSMKKRKYLNSLQLSDLKLGTEIVGRFQPAQRYIVKDLYADRVYVETVERSGRRWWEGPTHAVFQMYYVLSNFDLSPKLQFAKDLEEIINE